MQLCQHMPPPSTPPHEAVRLRLLLLFLCEELCALPHSRQYILHHMQTRSFSRNLGQLPSWAQPVAQQVTALPCVGQVSRMSRMASCMAWLQGSPSAHL